MGEIKTAIEFENYMDRAFFIKGIIGENKIRGIKTTGLVDTGAVLIKKSTFHLKSFAIILKKR